MSWILSWTLDHRLYSDPRGRAGLLSFYGIRIRMQLQTFYYFQVGVIVIPGNIMHMHYLGEALYKKQKHSDLVQKIHLVN